MANENEERKKKRAIITNGIEKGDILRHSYIDGPVKFYRVLSVYYWEDYEDALAELEDIETREETSMNTRNSGLQMHQKAEQKVFGWVQDNGQSGWKWTDITNTTGLRHIGENKYIEP